MKGYQLLGASHLNMFEAYFNAKDMPEAVKKAMEAIMLLDSSDVTHPDLRYMGEPSPEMKFELFQNEEGYLFGAYEEGKWQLLNEMLYAREVK